jgi:phosphoserine aminotransferase
VIAERNRQKARLLYEAIDASHLYRNAVLPHYRSIMNIPFQLAREELESVFLKEAKEAGLVNLKGHRLVGGLRASIYNAMPLAGVNALINFMRDFEQRHG